MPLSKSLIQQRFDRKASSYDAHANVQKRMADALLQQLHAAVQSAAVPAPTSILEIGCGTGHLTERLLSMLPSAHITAVDLSPAMIQIAGQRVAKHASRCSFIQADIEQWAPSRSHCEYDLIISNACFQWLTDPQLTLKQLGKLIRPGGMLLFSTFGPDTFHELHTAFQHAYIAMGKPAQRHGLTYNTSDQWAELLTSTGWPRLLLRHEETAEHFASVRAFLQSVKSIGASASQASPVQGLGARRLLAEMSTCYEREYASPLGIPATYDLLYIQALRPHHST